MLASLGCVDAGILLGCKGNYELSEMELGPFLLTEVTQIQEDRRHISLLFVDLALSL